MVGDEFDSYDPLTQADFKEVERAMNAKDNEKKAEKTWAKRLAFRSAGYQCPSGSPAPYVELAGFFENVDKYQPSRTYK